VHTDYRQHISVLFFQLPQLRKYMHAVNSAVGPEVEDYQSTAQISQCQRRRSVEPLEVFWKLRGVDGAFIFRSHSVPPFC
jgi:hypothetical protein